MDRTSGLGYVLDANGHRVFADQNLAGGVDGTDVEQVWLTGIQEELIAGLIEYAGLTPNVGDNTQVRQAILILIARALAGYLPLAGGTVTGSVTIEQTLGVEGQGTFAGSCSVGGNLIVGNAVVASGNVTSGGFLTAGDVYSSNYLLAGPSNGNLTPCQSAATGTSMSGGQLNAYNQSGSSGQFGTAAAGDLIDFWVGNVGTISIQGKITTTGTGVVYGTTSDRRLKQDVVPLTGALDRLDNLQAKRFAFRSAPGVIVDGFIADEAQLVSPQAVAGKPDAVDDKGDILPQTMDASALVPILWAAMGELKSIVLEQGQQIAALMAARAV